MKIEFKDKMLLDLKKMDIHDYMKLMGIDVDYEGVARNFEELENVLEKYALTDLWDYPLDEIEHCNEMGYNVVIVYYYNEMGIQERLYQID